MTSSVVVVGSLSFDMVFKIDRRPGKGETIKGDSFETFVGGKGNNQALAAAKSGALTAMVGRVGNDAYGQMLIDNLVDNNVDISCLMKCKDQGTGLANIYVDPDGDNSIVIVPRANEALTPADVDNAIELIQASKIILLQLESPLPSVLHAAKRARQAGKTVILNPAPAPPDGKLPAQIFQYIDYLLPNQSETELMTGIKVIDERSAFAASKKLKALNQYKGNVIITMAEKGVSGLTADDTEITQASFPVST
ncbi:MAG: ribokinase, partial [Candidatus Obscuribacterales bacterium]|nr:ribokinase [Candidatus Obscuribacterales bacterium]